jgi:hypothetical protein
MCGFIFMAAIHLLKKLINAHVRKNHASTVKPQPMRFSSKSPCRCAFNNSGSVLDASRHRPEITSATTKHSKKSAANIAERAI